MASKSIECPRCGSQSDASVQTCATCGIDLEWAREHWSSVVSGPQETYAPIILYVDDEIGALTLIGIILERAGYRVAKARDAYIALEITKRFIPDLIITDDMMPGMSGIEMTSHLKADPVLRDVPVVGITVRGGTLLKAAMEAGAVCCLHLPGLAHWDMAAVVGAILGDKRLPLVFFMHGEVPRVALGNRGYRVWAPAISNILRYTHANAALLPEDITRWLNTPLEPHVITIGFHLDDLEGLDVLQQLKADPSVRHIPVVMLAEEPEPELAQRAMALGASAVYTGPLDAEKLAEVFEAVLAPGSS